MALWIAAPLAAACAPAGLAQPRSPLSRSDLGEAASSRERHTEGFLPWAADEPLLIVVDKTSRQLVLYRSGEPIKSYPVVLGRNPGRKLYEGDRRTPSGLYHISGKRVHSRYVRFLAIDYPNEHDRANYRAALSRGSIPRARRTVSSNAVAGVGGQVGIHGTDKEELNRVGINWTFGCVSLANRDVEELYGLVPDGTWVVIRDELPP